MSEKKKGFLARRAEGTMRYVGRRFGNQFINEVGRDTLRGSATAARDAMRPGEADADDVKAGYKGRYPDGGKARFAEMAKSLKLNHADLAELAAQKKLHGRIMFGAGSLFLIIGVYLMVTSDDVSGMLYGFTTAFTCLIFGALGIRNDFSRWQIENRRFGAFQDYLKGHNTPVAQGKEVVVSKTADLTKR